MKAGERSDQCKRIREVQRSEGKGSLGGCERVCRSMTGYGAKGGEVVKSMRQVRGVRRVQDICGACGFAWKGVRGRKKSKGWGGHWGELGRSVRRRGYVKD